MPGNKPHDIEDAWAAIEKKDYQKAFECLERVDKKYRNDKWHFAKARYYEQKKHAG